MPRGRRTTGDMSAAVSSLHSALDSLLSQRSKIDGQIGAIEGALRAFNAPAAGAARRGRPAGSGGGRAAKGAYRKGSLKEHIQRALGGGGQMRVIEVAAAVKRGGFKTKNKTLDKSVGIALKDMPTVERVARGVFKLK